MDPSDSAGVETEGGSATEPIFSPRHIARLAQTALGISLNGDLQNFCAFPPSSPSQEAVSRQSTATKSDRERCLLFLRAAASMPTPISHEQVATDLARIHPRLSRDTWLNLAEACLLPGQVNDHTCKQSEHLQADIVTPQSPTLESPAGQGREPCQYSLGDSDVGERKTSQPRPPQNSEPPAQGVRVWSPTDAEDESDDDTDSESDDEDDKSPKLPRTPTSITLQLQTEPLGRQSQRRPRVQRLYKKHLPPRSAAALSRLVNMDPQLTDYGTGENIALKSQGPELAEAVLMSKAAFMSFWDSHISSLGRWGLSLSDQDICFIQKTDFAETPAIMLRRLAEPERRRQFHLNLYDPSQRITGVYLTGGAQNTLLARLLCWFSPQSWPPNARRLVEYREQTMDASHLCHQGLCVNPHHVLFEPHSTNLDRITCKGFATVQRRMGGSIDRHCSIHDPPCKLHNAALTAWECLLIQASVMYRSLNVTAPTGLMDVPPADIHPFSNFYHSPSWNGELFRDCRLHIAQAQLSVAEIHEFTRQFKPKPRCPICQKPFGKTGAWFQHVWKAHVEHETDDAIRSEMIKTASDSCGVLKSVTPQHRSRWEPDVRQFADMILAQYHTAAQSTAPATGIHE